MRTLQLQTAQWVSAEKSGTKLTRLLERALELLPLKWMGNDDSFVSTTLKARVLSGTYFEIDVRSLSNQTLTLQSDCEIWGRGVLKTGSTITDISYRREDVSTEKKWSAKFVEVITFTVWGETFQMNSTDFKVVLKLCLKTSKTISLLCS